MNLLQQTKSFLTGSEDDINSLAKKESAVILAVSDSHGRSEVLKQILNTFGHEADLLVFCGDGAPDFIQYIEHAKKNKREAKNIPPVCAVVQGNGDDNYYPVSFNLSHEKSSRENFLFQVPKSVSLTAAGTNIFVTHGHSFGVYYGLDDLSTAASQNKNSLCFYGHTHIAARTEINGVTLINPGSCALPRRGLPPSFAIIKIPGEYEKISSSFYEIKLSLTDGFSFEQFSPEMRIKW